MKISEFAKKFEEIIPTSLAEDFDNVGLIVGRDSAEITSVLTCLDADENVVDEAVSLGANLIVTHHPIIFHATKRIDEHSPVSRTVLKAAENKIAIYAAHTNLDGAKGGLNDFFFEKIGVNGAAPIDLESGQGRIAEIEPVTAAELCEKIKSALGLKYIRTTADPCRIIKKAALCTGSGGSFVDAVISQNADVYICGELRHSDSREMYFSGTDYIEVSHYDSEKIATVLLASIIRREMPNITVFESKTNIDVFKIL